MRILLNREAPVSLRDQLRAQLEVGILTGALSPGEQLPSVRALSLRLGVHRTTLLGAYHDLVAAGNVAVHRSAGVYVRSNRPDEASLGWAVDSLREGVGLALARGLTKGQVRDGVARLLMEGKPRGVLVADPSLEMGPVYALEIARATSMPATAATLKQLRDNPKLAERRLVVALPHHLKTVREILVWSAVHPFRLTVSPVVREAVANLRSGGLVLVVSDSRQLLDFSVAVLSAEAATGVVIEEALLEGRRDWRRTCAGADVVLADAVAARRIVGRIRAKLIEMSLLDATSLAEIAAAAHG